MEQLQPSQTPPQGHEGVADILKQVLGVAPEEMRRREAEWNDQRVKGKKSKPGLLPSRPAAP